MPSNQLQFWPLDCIPSVQEGEMLFSWCALYHRLSGASFAGTTSKRLFDSLAGGFVRDFPGRLDQLVQVTNGLLGDADKIISEHTLYRLYAKFRSDKTMAQARAMMRGSSVERLKFILGLPSSRANTCHPLKFCRKCVEDEVKECGFARWWRNLQWPTVWICDRHAELLDWAIDGSRGSSRSVWFFPSDLEPSEIASMDTKYKKETVCLTKLARLTIQIANLNDQYFSPEILKLTFLAKFKDRGWVSAYGSIQYADIRDVFLNEYDEMRELPGMEFIHSLLQDDYGFLGTIIRGRETFLHPSKYLLMINLLFDDIKSFLSVYEQYAKTVDVVKMKMHILDPDRELREQMLYRLILTERRSLNQVSILMNMPIVSVIAWARKNGIKYEQRPRLETEQLLLNIQKLISRGAGREEMATKLGVRRRWLITFFKRHPNLREEWQRRNLNAVTQERREAFKKIVKECQGVPLKKLILIPGNGYRWLYKHDRQWLKDNLPLLSS